MARSEGLEDGSTAVVSSVQFGYGTENDKGYIFESPILIFISRYRERDCSSKRPSRRNHQPHLPRRREVLQVAGWFDLSSVLR